MNIREQNGIANFLYRIFIAPDEAENDETLNVNSNDAIEKELAKSEEDIDKKFKSHFESSKGKSKFKVEESQLNKNVKSSGAKKKETGKEKETENVREM